MASLGQSAIAIAAGDATNTIVADSESPLSYLSALLLTIVAMKFAYTDSLPKLSYLTFLDSFIFIHVAAIIIAMFLCVNISEKQLKDSQADMIYIWMLLAVNAVFALWAWKVYIIPQEHEPNKLFNPKTPL